MSAFIEPTLSVIIEEERSQSEPSSRYERVEIPETSRYYDPSAGIGIGGQRVSQAHTSILSSDTSYGEILPPGQSTFKSLGLGMWWDQLYDKSLPSLPPGSVVAARSAASASARSAQKSDSRRESMAKTESTRHSLARSESSARHSVPIRSSPVVSPRASARPVSPPHTPAKPLSVASEPVVLPLSPAPSHVPSSVSKATSVSTHSSTGSTSSASSTSSTSSSVSKSTSSSSTSTANSKSGSLSSATTQSTIRTFDDVVDEVATSLALRTKMHAQTVGTSERTKIGVCMTLSRGSDEQNFIRILADKLHSAMTLHSSYLFALSDARSPATLVFCGAPQQLVTKASILAGLRFKTRLAELVDTTGTWVGHLEAVYAGHPGDWDPHAQDEDVLWDIVRKAANPVDPAVPPPGSRSVDQLLADARARLDRLTPREAFTEAVQEGILVDIRPAHLRVEHGGIPGAMIIERNVLEWRFDPRSKDGRLPIADRYDLRVIVFCQEGYTSSLAAAALQDIGLWRATDIDGGFARWKKEGFPTDGVHEGAHSVDPRSMSPSTMR